MLGPVAETLSGFIADPPVEAPVGMISFDLDYYSSTVEAFDIFKLPDECHPAAGDVLHGRYRRRRGMVLGLHRRQIGNTRVQRAQRRPRKLSLCYDFVEFGFERWQEKVMIYHDFAHSRYNSYVGDEQREAQIPLKD